MDQQTANALFEKGALLLFLDAPPNMEFGVDCYSWVTGPKFKGLKLIPPGLHFIYYSAHNKHGDTAAVRTGFWRRFEAGQVVVKRWNNADEDVFPDEGLNAETEARFKSNYREFDRFLGAYPLVPQDNDPISPYQKWLSLITHVTTATVKKVLPPSGKISAMTSVSRYSDVQDSRSDFKSRGGTHAMDVDPEERAVNATGDARAAKDVEPSLQKMTKGDLGASNIEQLFLNFTPVDLKRSFPPGATGAELTKYSRDKSYLLKQLLTHEYKDYRELLGELQLSFLIFLLGEVYDGYEHWKTLIHLLCQSEEAIVEYGETLYSDFIETLQAQLNAHPSDFFVDALSADNFIRHNILQLTRSIHDLDATQVSPQLGQKLDALVEFVREKFLWDIKEELRAQTDEEEDEEGEFAPTVVGL
ncbi:A1 cistron-splicing factor [Fimicolochytrium jonesii]|uniref:A1 cistron-splicing factor n=1 Tax=Fimicolochytrium jonesii TaxID=1396493 RepID=UPI0022FDE1F0|nr:A1 cistron-splicing factor [Fimicolochytrium jonesii]KAI8825683.1 A1 cistron-splicing factor [Fimicolochytrium jonesii]